MTGENAVGCLRSGAEYHQHPEVGGVQDGLGGGGGTQVPHREYIQSESLQFLGPPMIRIQVLGFMSSLF